jgi:hypothetical protein
MIPQPQQQWGQHAAPSVPPVQSSSYFHPVQHQQGRSPSPPRAHSSPPRQQQAPAPAMPNAASASSSSAHESLFQVVAPAGLKVRDGASSSCKQVGFLPSQSLVRISSRHGDWARLLHPRFGGHHSVWICEEENGEPSTKLLDLRRSASSSGRR